MSESTYDIVILGAGSGGYATALRAAQLGMKVALIDGDKVGGTCPVSYTHLAPPGVCQSAPTPAFSCWEPVRSASSTARSRPSPEPA